MGAPKAGLEWHGSTLLRRVTGLVARGVDGTVVVVRASGQALPALPSAVEVVDDVEEGRGPLQGIATGLEALAGRYDSAFVCSTDLPFLHPAFVRRVTRALDGDVALPVVRGFRQPLAAAYRTALAGRARALLAQDRDRAGFLLEGAQVAVLDEAALLSDSRLQRADPGLTSVDGVNDPAEYDAARSRPAPEVEVQRFGVLAGSGSTRVRAATLGAAAEAVGLVLDRHLLAAVDGDAVVRDLETPLAQGDVVTFLSADAGG
ncbi:MAG: Molybdopterin-guanine dinucleotide biosynthesis protein A-like protein [Frankiales bacterium]|jgi:molybdopterin-guanine dinucleotide biosynthesis protein A|nr:Molybdopterin-guanine dinucleotide biosynthesis protein A-like protein [Frankiales bacterium]